MTTETKQVSVCCKAEAIEDFKDNPRDHHDPIAIYTCGNCHKECDVEDVCALCNGEGEVATDELDHDSHQVMRGVGTEKCLCQVPDEYDESDEQ